MIISRREILGPFCLNVFRTENLSEIFVARLNFNKLIQYLMMISFSILHVEFLK